MNGGKGGCVGGALSEDFEVCFGFVEVVFLLVFVAFFVLGEDELIVNALRGRDEEVLELELIELDVLVGRPAVEDVDTVLEVEIVWVALADTVGTPEDSVREALVCGRSSPQSQGSVP